jgi:hypothetical protein
MPGPVAARRDRITTVPESSFSPTIRAARAAIRQNSALRQQNVAMLRQHIGRPDFYEQMARIDPRSAGEWRRMVGMQARFQRGEAGYDSTTRTYSESMRESLHRAAIELYRRERPGQIFDHFIAIHPALFNANSAFSGRVNGIAVLQNTNFTEVFRNFNQLAIGANNGANYARLANQVAEETRISRERRGLPITPR